MATTIYRTKKTDPRHSCLGVYVDIDGCFELPVGPFQNSADARGWVEQSADRLVELYGRGAIAVVNQIAA